MIQITPENYFSQQAQVRRIEPKQEEKKPTSPPIIIGQPQPTPINQESTMDKFYPLIVLGIIALFLITLIAILKKD